MNDEQADIHENRNVVMKNKHIFYYFFFFKNWVCLIRDGFLPSITTICVTILGIYFRSKPSLLIAQICT